MTEINRISEYPSVKVIWKVVNVLYYLGWVAFGLLFVVIVMLFATDNNVKYIILPISVSYENSDAEPLEELNYYNEYPVVGFKNIKIDINNEGGFDFSILILLCMILAYIWILKQIKLFFKTVKENDPFNRENPRRIRLVGFVVMVSGPIMASVQYFIAVKYLYAFDFPGATVEIETDFYPVAIFLGLIIFVIGHIYDLAVKLKEEQDLTI